MRARTWGRFATGLVLSTALTLGFTALTLGVLEAPMAQADTAPPVPNDPTNPETVSTKPLPTVQIDGVVWSQTVVGDTVYVAGQFTTARPAGSAPGVNTVTRSNLLAYDITTGNLIDNWVANANGEAQVVTASPDGKHIYVGGTFTTITGSNGTALTRRRIASLDPTTGAVQAGFDPNPDAKVNAIAATNTTVYFGGVFGTAGGASRSRLAAWQPTPTGNGTLLAWAPAAVGGAVAALTLTSDGQKVVAGGQFTTMNGSGNPGYGMAALEPTSGALVPWAAASTIRNGGPNAGINSLTTDNDSVYATGFHFGSGGNLEGTARINNDGTVNWVEDCHGDTYGSYSLKGVVYKVGHAHYCGNVPGGFAQPQTWRFYRGLAVSKQATGVARAEYLGYANWAGTKTPSLLQWFPQLDAGSFTGSTQAAWSLAGNDSYLVAGGEFPSADGMAQQGLVRYATKSVAGGTEAPDLTFSKWVPTVTSPGQGQALISWQSNYDRDSRNLTYKVYRNGVQINIQTSGSNLWDRPYLNFLDTGQTPGATLNYRVSAYDSEGNEARSNTVSVTISGSGSGPDAYSQAVLKDGPQSYWRLDESSGTGMADYTGLDPMTAQAGVTRTATGAISGRGAASFNGTPSQTAASGTLQEGPWWFSVEAWFQTSSPASVGRIVGFSGSQTGTSAANSYDRAVYMSSGGKLNFGAKQSSNRIVTTSGSYNDNKWHHVVGVIGDSGTNLYVDGNLAAGRQDLHTAGSYSGYWRLGGDTLSGWDNRPASDYFSGSIDDVAVYQQALTGNQVHDHYSAAGGAMTDTTPTTPPPPPPTTEPPVPTPARATATTIAAAGTTRVTLTGRLMYRGTSSGVPGSTMVAQRKVGTAWVNLATVTTNSTGYAAFAFVPTGAYYYRWVHAATATTTASSSGAVWVRVPTKQTMATSFAKKGSTIRGRLLSSTTGRAIAGQRLVLQRRCPTCRWSNVRSVRTGGAGYATTKLKAGRPTYFRWVYATSTAWGASISAQGYLRR